MTNSRTVLLAMLAGLCSAAPAFADPAAWSSSANACVATSASINADRYATSNFVAYKGTNLDPIVLNCAVTTLGGVTSIGWELSLTYLDSTGSGTGAVVKAVLYKQSRTTGVTSAITTVSSNNDPATGINKLGSTTVPGFDFDGYVYFVQTTLDRSAAGQTVRAYSVALAPTPV